MTDGDRMYLSAFLICMVLMQIYALILLEGIVRQ